jgi:hypothetical protein
MSRYTFQDSLEMKLTYTLHFELLLLTCRQGNNRSCFSKFQRRVGQDEADALNKKSAKMALSEVPDVCVKKIV